MLCWCIWCCLSSTMGGMNHFILSVNNALLIYCAYFQHYMRYRLSLNKQRYRANNSKLPLELVTRAGIDRVMASTGFVYSIYAIIIAVGAGIAPYLSFQSYSYRDGGSVKDDCGKSPIYIIVAFIIAFVGASISVSTPSNHFSRFFF